MARVLVLTADLLFGSRVQGALVADGHEVELLAGDGPLRVALAERTSEALIVDLTDDQLGAAQIVAGLDGLLEGVVTLGFYSHVDPGARDSALAAGVAVVVPRSRMAREGPVLLAELLARPA